MDTGPSQPLQWNNPQPPQYYAYQPPIPTLAPTLQLTQAPTTEPTVHSTQASSPSATSTSIPTASGPAILGANLGAFVAKYGQPNDHSIASGGLYHFQCYTGSNTDFLIVQTDAADGSVYTQRVEGVTAQAPESGWSSSEASTICAGFFPHDAVIDSCDTLIGTEQDQ